MKIQCSSCGASFEVNERTHSSVYCPYCGSYIQVNNSNTPNPSARKYQRIIPFKISERNAVDIMLKMLVRTEGVPVDIFQYIENIRVYGYFMPMYMLNGEIHAPWNATQVERRERQVRDRNGIPQTEYYYEKWPINGMAQSAYWLLSSANCNSNLPYALREYGKVIKYTHAMASESISDEVQEINYQLPDGCMEIETDTDNHTVFNSQPVSNYIHRIAIQAAMSQLPSSYENFRCAPRWTNNVVEFVGVAVYYIQFSYKGKIYDYCIDGLGYSSYSNFPQDHNAIESLRKSIRNKRIYTWLLCLFGIAMPLIGTFGITRWPVGLLLAFVAMPIAMLITLLILISKERRAILSNEEEQREYGRRVYCREDTSGVDGNASTKLRVVTSILLWIGLAVDIAAIIISVTISPYNGQTYPEDEADSVIVETTYGEDQSKSAQQEKQDRLEYNRQDSIKQAEFAKGFVDVNVFIERKYVDYAENAKVPDFKDNIGARLIELGYQITDIKRGTREGEGGDYYNYKIITYERNYSASDKNALWSKVVSDDGVCGGYTIYFCNKKEMNKFIDSCKRLGYTKYYGSNPTTLLIATPSSDDNDYNYTLYHENGHCEITLYDDYVKISFGCV